MELETENRLTCTNSIGTLVQVIPVDATAQKLVKRMKDLESEKWRIDRELRAIRTALGVAGIKPGKFKDLSTTQELDYVTKQPFRNMTLRECCLLILRDHVDLWRSKAEIEYLISRGGYKFSTNDSKNSVGVTLQRLKDDGMCEVERVRGAHGNRYRWLPERSRQDAAATNDERK
jgi:hypothetical protein